MDPTAEQAVAVVAIMALSFLGAFAIDSAPPGATQDILILVLGAILAVAGVIGYRLANGR